MISRADILKMRVVWEGA